MAYKIIANVIRAKMESVVETLDQEPCGAAGRRDLDLHESYSPSFDFGQLRSRAWRLHTVDKAAADARRSPKSAGSCARPSGLTQCAACVVTFVNAMLLGAARR